MDSEDRVREKKELLERLKKKSAALDEETALDRSIKDERKKIEKLRPKGFFEQLFEGKGD